MQNQRDDAILSLTLLLKGICEREKVCPVSYCSKCGSYIPDSALVCPACGKPKFGASGSAQAQEKQAREDSRSARRERPGRDESTGTSQYDYSYHYKYDDSTPRSTVDEEAYRDFGYDDDTDAAGEDRMISALGYLGPLVLLPLMARPNSEFARFHANQSLVLMIFSILCSIAGVVPAVGWIASAFGGIYTIYGLIKGMSNAIQGKKEKLPLIGDINILGKIGGKK